MRVAARSCSSAWLLAAASALAACAPTPPTRDAAVEASTGIVPAIPASTDTAATPSAGSIAGPRYDAPCATPAEAVALQSAETPPRSYAFGLRDDIRACVHFRAQADGGRRSAVFSHYRPNVRFIGTGGEIVATHLCAVRFDANGAVEPGSSVAAHLKCEGPVEIEDGSTFVLIEGGREVARGAVVLPPA